MGRSVQKESWFFRVFFFRFVFVTRNILVIVSSQSGNGCEESYSTGWCPFHFGVIYLHSPVCAQSYLVITKSSLTDYEGI